MKNADILIEGLRPDELISLEDLEIYAAIGRPIVISVGSAEVLAEFSIDGRVLGVELAVVDRGDEGVLFALIDVIEKSALRRGLTAIEWSVYARNCAEPNPKLERVLQATGFEIRKTVTGSEFYWQRRSTNNSLLRRRG